MNPCPLWRILPNAVHCSHPFSMLGRCCFYFSLPNADTYVAPIPLSYHSCTLLWLYWCTRRRKSGPSTFAGFCYHSKWCTNVLRDTLAIRCKCICVVKQRGKNEMAWYMKRRASIRHDVLFFLLWNFSVIDDAGIAHFDSLSSLTRCLKTLPFYSLVLHIFLGI